MLCRLMKFYLRVVRLSLQFDLFNASAYRNKSGKLEN